MRELRGLCFLMCFALLVGCGDDDDELPIDAADGVDAPDGIDAADDVDAADGALAAITDLTGEAEVPPVATTATGQATATLTGNTLEVAGEFQGLESDLTEVGGTSAHIHEGDVDEAGPVVFNLDVDSDDMRSGTLSGTFELSEDERQTFADGLYYINVHTEDNPGGEIRGQLIPEE